MKGLRVTQTDKGCTFVVYVLPRSGHDRVVGLHEDALRVRLKAPPVEGRANRALQVFLARRLGVAVEAVEIIAGRTSRHKVVRVGGVGRAELEALLNDAQVAGGDDGDR